MADRSNWERERMQDRGREGNRENWGRGREDWRDSDWEREPRYSSAEERNRGHEGRYGYGGEEWRREPGREESYGEGRQGHEEHRGAYGRGEGRWNEGRGYDSRHEGPRGYEESRGYDRSRGFEGSQRYEGPREEREHGNEERRREYGGYGRGDYGPGAFTRQFRGGPEYFGAGQRGFGTTWGGSGYAGWGGASGYSGGLGTYGEQGRYTGRGPKGYQRSDDRIREDVCERLTHHPDIDATEIEIQVKDGEVTLLGVVERREEKRMAEDVAESVSGVKDVHNQLRAQHHQAPMAGQGTQGVHANRETATQKTK